MLVGIPPYYSENLKALYKNISSGKLKMPSYITEDCRYLILSMLKRKPEKRITIQQLKRDPFFKDINWDKLVKKEIEPPIKLVYEAEESDVPAHEKEYLNRVLKKCNFNDKDYENKNDTLNRVLDFSFVRSNSMKEKTIHKF